MNICKWLKNSFKKKYRNDKKSIQQTRNVPSVQSVLSTFVPCFSGVDLIMNFRVYMYILENLSFIYTLNVRQHSNQMHLDVHL